MYLFPGGATVAKSPVAITFVASTLLTTNQTVFTFSGHSLGTAASGRKLVVSAASRGGPDTVSSITIGGTSAAKIVEKQGSAGTDYMQALWYADKDTGTSGDIVVTWSGGVECTGLGVWAVYGAASGNAAVSDFENTYNTDPMTSSLTLAANSGAIGCTSIYDVSGTIAWTGLDEDFDENVDTNIWHSGASKVFAAAQSPLSIIANQSAALHIVHLSAGFNPA